MRIITAEKFSSEDFRFVNPTCAIVAAMEDVTQATYDYRALAKSPAF